MKFVTGTTTARCRVDDAHTDLQICLYHDSGFLSATHVGTIDLPKNWYFDVQAYLKPPVIAAKVTAFTAVQI